MIKIFALGFIFLTMNGCEGWLWNVAQTPSLAGPKKQLNVLILAEPLSYRKTTSGTYGLEYDLLNEFAQDSGYELKFKSYRDVQSLLKAFRRGEGQIASGRFTSSWAKPNQALLGPSYDEQKIVLACPRKFPLEANFLGRIPRDAEARVLLSHRHISGESSQYLQEMYSSLQVFERGHEMTRALLTSAGKGLYDCVAADEMSLEWNLRFFPQFEVKGILPLASSYHFLVSKSEAQLHRELSLWYQRAARYGEIFKIKDRYQIHLGKLPNIEERAFIRRLNRDGLSEFGPDFRKSARQFQLPWQLVAAVSYQESKWNPEALSFTGVKGLMQLTQATADFVGIADRTNPQQSIYGGSKYLRFLLNKQPKHLPYRERMALALAAYNVGCAHLEDAQILAEEKGLNPHSWSDLQKVLPLLADPDYWPKLKYGPARGQEPVDFVHRVLNYYDFLHARI